MILPDMSTVLAHLNLVFTTFNIKMKRSSSKYKQWTGIEIPVYTNIQVGAQIPNESLPETVVYITPLESNEPFKHRQRDSRKMSFNKNSIFKGVQ